MELLQRRKLTRPSADTRFLIFEILTHGPKPRHNGRVVWGQCKSRAAVFFKSALKLTTDFGGNVTLSLLSVDRHRWRAASKRFKFPRFTTASGQTLTCIKLPTGTYHHSTFDYIAKRRNMMPNGIAHI